jgi:uncharacterized protein
MAKDSVVQAFEDFVQNLRFPCVGAKAALATHGIRTLVAGDMLANRHDRQILSELSCQRYRRNFSSGFNSLAVVFPDTPALDETDFETCLWETLKRLHVLDMRAYRWDSSVCNDSRSPQFGMSLGGTAYYVVGMHPGSSRYARRAPQATMVFNSHRQFRYLKETGKYDRMREVIRTRDLALQGCNNPMLSDHGISSEASQYSGRTVKADWHCPVNFMEDNDHRA